MSKSGTFKESSCSLVVYDQPATLFYGYFEIVCVISLQVDVERSQLFMNITLRDEKIYDKFIAILLYDGGSLFQGISIFEGRYNVLYSTPSLTDWGMLREAIDFTYRIAKISYLYDIVDEVRYIFPNFPSIFAEEDEPIFDNIRKGVASADEVVTWLGKTTMSVLQFLREYELLQRIVNIDLLKILAVAKKDRAECAFLVASIYMNEEDFESALRSIAGCTDPDSNSLRARICEQIHDICPFTLEPGTAEELLIQLAEKS